MKIEAGLLSLSALIFLSLAAAGAQANSSTGCTNPKPLFGKILATCGDQMLTYVGDQRIKTLGISTTTSRFELAFCENGGGRYAMHMSAGTEATQYSSLDYYSDDNYRIIDGFEMDGSPDFKLIKKEKGIETVTTCQPFKDKRKRIDYIY